MKPGRITGASVALGKPRGWDEEKEGPCDALWVRDRNGGDDGQLESAWFPTDEEKAAIAAGRPVILTVWGRGHPPVSLNAYPQPDCICPCRAPSVFNDKATHRMIADKCRCDCHVGEGSP